jgi:hypothetical protein
LQSAGEGQSVLEVFFLRVEDFVVASFEELVVTAEVLDRALDAAALDLALSAVGV